MISFKVKPENHRVIARWSKRVFATVFVAGAVLLASRGIDGYRTATAILSDHGSVTVPVELVELGEERGRKGRTRTMYHFGYSFEVDGQRHEGRFTTSESNAGPYLAEDATVEVVYAKADPARFDRRSRLESQSGLGGLLVRLLVAVAGAALLASLLHLLVVAKLIVPRQPETGAAQPA